jgi:hypothetical protein
MDIVFMIFTLIVISGFMFYFTRKDKSNTSKPFTFNDIINQAKLNENDVALYNKFGQSIKDIIQSFNCIVTVAECLSVVKKESGYKGLSIDNSEIIGDLKYTNKAYGIFQVRKPALTDVNNFYHLVYKEEDLKLLHVNIIAGVLYLNLCKLQAKREVYNEEDIKYLTFKKYNGGIGISLDKQNTAHSYSLSAINNLESFNNIV